MDEIAGFILGIGAFILLICLVIYVLAFLFMAAMFLVPCYFLGRQFFRQVTKKYRFTWVSILVLFLVGVSSVMVGLGLVEIMKEPQGYSYILMAPLFLCLATSTLGIWGLAKVLPFWLTVLKSERVRNKGQVEIKGMERKIARLSRNKKALESEHGSLLGKRKGIEGRVHEFCTRAGDQRMQTLLKERLELEYEKLSLNDIEERINSLKVVSDQKEENELKKCLLEIALIDVRTGNAKTRLKKEEEKIASLRMNRQQFEEIAKKAEQQVRSARISLNEFKTQRIILD